VASYLFWADTNGVHCGGVSNAQEGNNVPTQCIHMTNETQTKFEMLNVQKCSLRQVRVKVVTNSNADMQSSSPEKSLPEYAEEYLDTSNRTMCAVHIPDHTVLTYLAYQRESDRSLYPKRLHKRATWVAGRYNHVGNLLL